jgi:hypothetical protein
LGVGHFLSFIPGYCLTGKKLFKFHFFIKEFGIGIFLPATALRRNVKLL